jgi:polysaccharide export outer membrane protein
LWSKVTFEEVKKPVAGRGAEMNGIAQRSIVKMVSGWLTSIGIAVLLGTTVCASGAQEEPKPPKVAATGRATIQDLRGSDKEEAPPELQRRNPRYELSKGDTFDLTFPLTPEFDQTVTVQPDGYITLSSLGDLYVAGKTVPELRELLRTAYAKILLDPVINVVLKDFEKPYFIAGGQVSHPGKFDLRDDTTLTEAIAIAGGFTENSKHSQVLLFRRVSNDWAEVKVLNVKKMFQTGNLTEDLHLQPGDMFFVPQNYISKIKKWIPYTSMGLDPTRF